MHGRVERKTVRLFMGIYKIASFTIKFQLLNDLCDDLDKFGSVTFLNAPVYEKFRSF